MSSKDIPMDALSRALRRLLDGEPQWGSLSIYPDRFGARYTLLVYPPDVTAGERSRIRIWRGWPVWGALLWIFSEITLTRHIDPWYALIMSTGILVLTGVIAFVRAGESRRRVRTLGATLLPRQYDPRSTAACRRLEALAARLDEAETQRAQGLMEPAQFEMTWWQVYNEIAATAAPRTPVIQHQGRPRE